MYEDQFPVGSTVDISGERAVVATFAEYNAWRKNNPHGDNFVWVRYPNGTMNGYPPGTVTLLALPEKRAEVPKKTGFQWAMPDIPEID